MPWVQGCVANLLPCCGIHGSRGFLATTDGAVKNELPEGDDIIAVDTRDVNSSTCVLK